MKKPIFANDYVYHIYNRGVDKRVVFQDDDDHFRFIHDLYEFNDTEPAENIYYKMKSYKSYEVELRKDRECVVEILAYVLMPNHFHLMLRQHADHGIVDFMQKLGTGYTNYFNGKNKRSGALFQGRFKAVLLENNTHFEYLPYYIHLNPLDIHAPEWRDGRLEKPSEAWGALGRYRWSSHLDYAGTKNFPSLLHMELLDNNFGTPDRYAKDLQRYLALLHGANAPKEVYID